MPNRVRVLTVPIRVEECFVAWVGFKNGWSQFDLLKIRNVN